MIENDERDIAENHNQQNLDILRLKDPTARRLKANGITSIEDLISLTEDDLRKMKGMGDVKIEEIKLHLEQLDLVLAEPVIASPLAQEPIALNSWIEGLPDKRKFVMQKLLEGSTLQKVGDAMDVTRERVRQISVKALETRPEIIEDKYLSLLSKYDFPEEIFCQATGQTTETYNYLQLLNKTKKDQLRPTLEALNDPNIDGVIKEAIQKNACRFGCIYEKDIEIPLDKRSIVLYLLSESHHGEPVPPDILLKEYTAFLKKHDIPSKGSLEPTSLRAFTACLDRFDGIITTRKPGSDDPSAYRSYRPAMDFSSLGEAMEILSTLNIECSCELLMRDSGIIEVMEEFDIHNAVELHSALRRYCDDIPNVELGRCPMLTLGTANRNEQVVNLIKELGPVNVEYLANEYEKRYGVRSDTVRGTFLPNFKIYQRNDGLYVYEHRDLTLEEKEYLVREIQKQGGYMPGIVLIKKFARALPDSQQLIFSQEVLDQIDCHVTSTLIVDNNIDLPMRFNELIQKHHRFDAHTDGFSKSIMRTEEFQSVLNKALRKFEIIEYEDGCYINVKEFEKLNPPLSAADFQDYMDSAISFMDPSIPYSLKSLHEAGFTHQIEELCSAAGMGDRFFESVISQGYVGGRLKRTNIEGIVLFCKTPGWFSLADVLELIVAQNGTMSIVDLHSALQGKYGVDIPLAKLRSAVKRADLRLEDDIVRAH